MKQELVNTCLIILQDPSVSQTPPCTCHNQRADYRICLLLNRIEGHPAIYPFEIESEQTSVSHHYSTTFRCPFLSETPDISLYPVSSFLSFLLHFSLLEIAILDYYLHLKLVESIDSPHSPLSAVPLALTYRHTLS